jgi:hypothetical protein
MSWNTGLARIGAAFYVLWGLLHYTAAYGMYQTLPHTACTSSHSLPRLR